MFRYNRVKLSICLCIVLLATYGMYALNHYTKNHETSEATGISEEHPLNVENSGTIEHMVTLNDQIKIEIWQDRRQNRRKMIMDQPSDQVTEYAIDGLTYSITRDKSHQNRVLSAVRMTDKVGTNQSIFTVFPEDERAKYIEIQNLNYKGEPVTVLQDKKDASHKLYIDDKHQLVLRSERMNDGKLEVSTYQYEYLNKVEPDLFDVPHDIQYEIRP